MSDLIDRQAAIDAINHICPVDTEYDCTLLDRMDVKCVLSDLPSAQPEEFEWCHDCKEYDKDAHCCHRWTKVIRQTVNELNEAQLERKKGKWEYTTHYGDRYRVCPFCKVERKDDLSNGWYFCPNCGADMRQKEGSDDNRLNNT